MTDLILVVEDETGIADFLERGLRAHGFEVTSALDGISGTTKALSENVDLVVLDMMLPQRNGLNVLAEVHAVKPAMPVIILTALDEVDQRVAGLDAGAADYLTKPFSLSELAARIRAQLRGAAQASSTWIRAGEVDVNMLTREVRVAGEPVRLSTTEFELLVHLMENRGRTLSREQIQRAVWGYDHDPGTNVVDVYIGYLRRKLAGDRRRRVIVTVRGVGYRFDGSQ